VPNGFLKFLLVPNTTQGKKWCLMHFLKHQFNFIDDKQRKTEKQKQTKINKNITPKKQTKTS